MEEERRRIGGGGEGGEEWVRWKQEVVGKGTGKESGGELIT